MHCYLNFISKLKNIHILAWIQKRSIAVLEYENHIVSVVRYTIIRRDALVIAPFTFPQFRRRGFVR
jgi:hypothetical protein